MDVKCIQDRHTSGVFFVWDTPVHLRDKDTLLSFRLVGWLGLCTSWKARFRKGAIRRLRG